MPHWRFGWRSGLVVLLLLGTPHALRSQTPSCEWQPARPDCIPDPAGGERLRESAVILGINAAVAGVSAGLLQGFGGGSFRDGFLRGAMGGAVSFAGKRVAVEPFYGAGLLGREIAAVGSSVVRNAGAGEPSLSELVFPIGPTRLYVRPGVSRPLQVQLDVIAATSLALAFADDEYAFDSAASLSSGTPVFRELEPNSRASWMGGASAGVIRLSAHSRGRSRDFEAGVIAHENVHVIQYDQGFLLAGAPLEKAIAPLIPGGETVGRWLDVGLELPLWAFLHQLVAYEDRPWESEAYALSRTRTERAGPGGMIPIPVGSAAAW